MDVPVRRTVGGIAHDLPRGGLPADQRRNYDSPAGPGGRFNELRKAAAVFGFARSFARSAPSSWNSAWYWATSSLSELAAAAPAGGSRCRQRRESRSCGRRKSKTVMADGDSMPTEREMDSSADSVRCQYPPGM